MPLKILCSLILSLWLACSASMPAMAQSGLDAANQVINTTFNQMPPFQLDGAVADIGGFVEQVGYNPQRAWKAGDLPAEVVKVGDVDTGLGASELSIEQISELTGLNLEFSKIEDLGFLEGLSLEQFITDIPFLGEWNVQDIPELAELPKIGRIFNGDQTLSSLLIDRPEVAQMNVLEVFGDLSVEAIPNLTSAQLKDFTGINEQTISNIPGLGDVSLGSFPIPVSLPSVNVFPIQDIAFGEKEYSGDKPTPQPVSGGTDGGRTWKPLACVGGCPHIELTDNGWEGAAWMTKAHRVKDGFGFLGSLFDEAGAYRLPFGSSFALQVVSTDEKTGQAEWGIAFRKCQRGLIDLGCTAYFLEVPLGIKTFEGDNILTGIRDGLGGSTVPMEAPPEWAEKRPDAPPELTSVINQKLGSTGDGPRRKPVCGSASVSGDVVDRAVEAMSELGWPNAADDISLLIGTALDNGITDPAHLAYLLATAGHESDGFRTMVEYGKGRGKAYGNDYGRGYIQVTWRENREKLDRILGINSADNPDLLIQPDIAAQAVAIGMRDGIYTGVSLSDYGSGDNFDWEGARSIINDGDRRPLIGNYGRTIYEKIAGTDPRQVEGLKGGCKGSQASGGVASLSPDATLDDIVYGYEPASFQQFDAERRYRNGWHGGIDLDYRVGFGEGGGVTSLTSGEILEIKKISNNEITNEPSISVRILTHDENGNSIEQRYTHLSESSVRAAIGVGVGEGAGMKIEAGQAIGQVGGDDVVSGGAHLDYKVLVNGQFSNPLDFMETLATGDNGGTLETIDIRSGQRGQITIGNVGGRESEQTSETPNAITPEKTTVSP